MFSFLAQCPAQFVLRRDNSRSSSRKSGFAFKARCLSDVLLSGTPVRYSAAAPLLDDAADLSTQISK